MFSRYPECYEAILEVLNLHVQRAVHLVTDAKMASVLAPVLVLELSFATYERKTNHHKIVKMDGKSCSEWRDFNPRPLHPQCGS